MIWTTVVFLDETGAVYVGGQNESGRRKNVRLPAAAPQMLFISYKSHCHEYDDEYNT